jgi:hypothetical protein
LARAMKAAAVSAGAAGGGALASLTQLPRAAARAIQGMRRTLI